MARELLVVDLDHTLVKTDLLLEQVVVVLRTRPLVLLRAIGGLLGRRGGRAAFKRTIAAAVDVDAAYLPYRDSVLELVDAERRKGARIVLASASHRTIVERVSRHLGRFDQVLGSDEINVKGRRKLEALRAAFPSEEFTYIGDSDADRPLWAECKLAIAVNPSAALRRWLKSLQVPVLLVRDEVAPLRVLARQLRMGRWVRNLLVFVPLLAAPSILTAALPGALAFAALSCLSSAGYILNDLTDLQADRRHAEKRSRPLASGDLSIVGAGALLVALLLVAVVAAAFLPRGFGAALVGYFAVSVAYSFWLKRLPLLDVFALAALYTLRIVAGAEAMAVPVSVWLLAFAIFLFLGLALTGRWVELARGAPPGEMQVHAYREDDQAAMFAMGTASAFLSVPALILYLDSDDLHRLYSSPGLLWLTALLLAYWISRHLMLAHRNELGEGLLADAMRGKTTWVVVMLALAAALIARL